MKHAQEHTLDIFIVNPALLDDNERSALKDHLESCEGCRRLADSIRAFYVELERKVSEPVADVRILMRLLYPPPSIVRFPTTSAHPGGMEPALARTTPALTHSIASSLMLERTSSAGEATLRIVLAPGGDGYQLELRPNTFELEECGIASLPGVETNVLLDGDGHGRLLPLPSGLHAGWEREEIVVRFPVARLHASNARARQEGRALADASGRIRATMVMDSGRIEIAFPPSEPEPPVEFLTVNDSTGNRMLLRSQDGVVTLPPESNPEELIIDVYT